VGSELWVVLLFALGLSLIVAEIFLVGVVLGLIVSRPSPEDDA